MLKRLLAFAVTAVVGGILAGGAPARTQVDHFTEGPFADEIAASQERPVFSGTSVFREGADGTFFAAGTFRGVFTADNGKSITVFAAGPAKQTSPPIIDEEAGTPATRRIPVGDFISEDFVGLHGPHPDLLSGFEVFCDVLEPYLLDP